jgi:hypothetical protein
MQQKDSFLVKNYFYLMREILKRIFSLNTQKAIHKLCRLKKLQRGGSDELKLLTLSRVKHRKLFIKYYMEELFENLIKMRKFSYDKHFTYS